MKTKLVFALCAVFIMAFQIWLAKNHAFQLDGIPQQVSVKPAEVVVEEKRVWKYTPWIPKTLEEKLYQISVARQGAISNRGNTLIDADVKLQSADEFIRYIPRALQVGLLSPMPEFWTGQGSSPAMTMARKIVGFVTLPFYVCLAGLVWGVWVFRKRLAIWSLLGFCMPAILVYAYAYPNVGTLMRYRYGFYMLLIGIGAAMLIQMFSNRKKHA